jgi:hypothetical protein
MKRKYNQTTLYFKTKKFNDIPDDLWEIIFEYFDSSILFNLLSINKYYSIIFNQIKYLEKITYNIDYNGIYLEDFKKKLYIHIGEHTNVKKQVIIYDPIIKKDKYINLFVSSKRNNEDKIIRYLSETEPREISLVFNINPDLFNINEFSIDKDNNHIKNMFIYLEHSNIKRTNSQISIFKEHMIAERILYEKLKYFYINIITFIGKIKNIYIDILFLIMINELHLYIQKQKNYIEELLKFKSIKLMRTSLKNRDIVLKFYEDNPNSNISHRIKELYHL